MKMKKIEISVPNIMVDVDDIRKMEDAIKGFIDLEDLRLSECDKYVLNRAVNQLDYFVHYGKQINRALIELESEEEYYDKSF